jgi:hypothetical protein
LFKSGLSPFPVYDIIIPVEIAYHKQLHSGTASPYLLLE